MILLPDGDGNTSIPAPLSDTTINDLKSYANQLTGTRRRLFLLELEVQEANREAHCCQMKQDDEGMSKAILRRCAAAGEIVHQQEIAAEECLIGLSHASKLRRDEIREVLTPLLDEALNSLRSEITVLANAIVSLEERDGGQ